MAREWLLRGVDPEELKRSPTSEKAPQTPRGKWENFFTSEVYESGKHTYRGEGIPVYRKIG